MAELAEFFMRIYPSLIVTRRRAPEPRRKALCVARALLPARTLSRYTQRGQECPRHKICAVTFRRGDVSHDNPRARIHED